MKEKPTIRIREIFEDILKEKELPENDPNALSYQALAIGMYLDEEWKNGFENHKHEFVVKEFPFRECAICGIISRPM